MFEEFQNYNQPEKHKHRKRHHGNFDYHTLSELSQSLFHLTSSSYFKTDQWKGVYESLMRLADNIKKYGSYLDKHVLTSQYAHERQYAATDVDHWKVYSAKLDITATKKSKYRDLHDVLQHAKP